jgi:hypothetical protein
LLHFIVCILISLFFSSHPTPPTPPPGHLRSAAALYKFFEKLFPGEVFNVEIALDLSELNALCAQRQGVRDSLEKVQTEDAVAVALLLYCLMLCCFWARDAHASPD